MVGLLKPPYVFFPCGTTAPSNPGCLRITKTVTEKKQKKLRTESSKKRKTVKVFIYDDSVSLFGATFVSAKSLLKCLY